MGRTKKGTAFTVDGGFTIQITTKEGKRPKKTLPAIHEGKTVTLAVARKLAQKCQNLYDAGHPVELFGLNQEKPKEAPSVIEYVQEWHSHQTYPSIDDERGLIKLYIKPTKIAQLRMGQVSKAEVREWLGWLKQQKPKNSQETTLAPKYLHKICSVLSRAFLAGAEFDDYKNPFAELSMRKLLPSPEARDPGQDNTYPREAVVKLLSHPWVRPDRKVLYALYFCAGLRANEALATRFKHYDTNQTPLGRLVISRAFRKGQEVTTKTKAVRFVPVHPTLASVLTEWKSSGFETFYGRAPQEEDFLVPQKDLTAKKHNATYKAFQSDCKRLGIQPKRLHDTRHTFISLVCDDGAEPDTVKRITHTPPKATAFDLYNRASWERLCRAILSLKIELPGREQKTLESALNIALSKNSSEQVSENTDIIEIAKRIEYSLHFIVLRARRSSGGNMRTATLILFSFIASLPVLVRAQDKTPEPTPISFNIPEKLINEQLKGQVFDGEGTYETTIGEIPYKWKMTDVSCSLKEGFAEIKATAEVTANGITSKEEVTGKIKAKLLVRKQIIKATPENIIIPIHMTVLGTKKKVGEVDLAEQVGTQEVEVSELISQASAFLPKDKEVTLTALNVVTGLVKIEFTLKDKTTPPPTTQPTK
jgi:integrase